MRRSLPTFRKLLLFAACLLVVAASASATSSAKLSCHLTKTKLTSGQASSVKLVCSFSKSLKSVSYGVTIKSGKKWKQVKSAKLKVTKGSCSVSVKSLFGSKSKKVGSYKLKVTAGSSSKTLSFSVGLAPSSTSPPTISGTAQQGQTLSSTTGSWKNSPTSYSRQWQRCNSSGGSCSSISGATSTTYVPSASDVGSTVRIAVTAKNAYDSTIATSAQTAVVASGAPADTALPTISGTARDGQTLTASAGTWSNSPTYSYQWQRCDSGGNNCSAISGATASTRILVGADDHSTLRVSVTATNSFGSAGATSAQTAAVSPIVAGVSSGGESGCAVLSDGTVECWGENDEGQLGDGTLTTINTTPSATPVQVTGISNAVQVSVGADFACAVLADHSVWCWGDDADGELGNGSTGSSSSVPLRVVGVQGTGLLANASAVSAGSTHACALLTDKTLVCWGYNGSGELGGGSTSGAIQYPMPVYSSGTYPTGALFTGVTQVSAGDQFTCAVKSDGTAWCWGSDTNWTLGVTTIADVYRPQQIAGFSGVSQVSAGVRTACAVKSDTTVWCWGYDSYSGLGNGSPGGGKVPQQVAALNSDSGHLTGASAVVTSDQHTCAIVSTGVDCWGDNTYGQLGNSTVTNTQVNHPVAVDGISAAIALSSGPGVDDSRPDVDTCALLSDHTIKCWGDNTFDQLGTGKIGHSETALTVSGITGLSQVSAGGVFACALRSSDGTVWCWGSNDEGQLGNGTFVGSSTPVEVENSAGTGPLMNVVNVSTGVRHACAMVPTASPSTTQNTVYCWGDNYYGQLGDNTTNTGVPEGVDRPVQVGAIGSTGTPPTPVIQHVVQIAVGGAHTCALINDGSVDCWGLNNEGQLGNGGTTPASLPTAVPSLSNVAQVSAGYYHTCAALNATGGSHVYCWGDDDYGQLGNNSTSQSNVPVEVSAVGGSGYLTAASVSSGGFHTCAVLSLGGNIACWGHNHDGQLGDGVASNTDQKVPVSVYASGTNQLTGAQQVSAGVWHTCAFVSGTTGGLIHLPYSDAVCWGYNDLGQLGDGTLSDRSNPVNAISIIGFVGVSEVSSGGWGNDDDEFSCALVGTSGNVECWGSNEYGQLGTPALPYSVNPVAVTGLPS